MADERSPGRWFSGFHHERFQKRKALGVIVLCRTRSGEVLDFGLGRELIDELDEYLQSTSARGAREIWINIRRDGARYLLEAGLGLFRSRSDKRWSLTDCVSFSLMRKRKIEKALSGDRHFRQAGFVALLL